MNDKSKEPPKQGGRTIPEKYSGRAYLRRAECSDISGLKVPFFDRLAWKGEGPPFVKTSPRGPALYPVAEFFEWLANLGK